MAVYSLKSFEKAALLKRLDDKVVKFPKAPETAPKAKSADAAEKQIQNQIVQTEKQTVQSEQGGPEL